MAQWHLDALERALTQRGWSSSVVVSPEYPLADGVWSLTRGPVSVTLEFGCFDGMGQPLPSAAASYGFALLGHPSRGLYFFKKSSPKWKPALQEFLDFLDTLEPDPGA